jgi:hypothetical protein
MFVPGAPFCILPGLTAALPDRRQKYEQFFPAWLHFFHFSLFGKSPPFNYQIGH